MLLGAGVQRGQRVALLQMNSIEFIESFMAIAKIGAICVPLNWRLVADELEFILADSGYDSLIFGAEFLDTVTISRRAPSCAEKAKTPRS